MSAARWWTRTVPDDVAEQKKIRISTEVACQIPRAAGINWQATYYLPNVA